MRDCEIYHCYEDGDHVTCADLRVGGTVRVPCPCSCHDNDRPRPMQPGCEKDITDEVGNWLNHCGAPPIKIHLERSYCAVHSAEQEALETLDAARLKESLSETKYTVRSLCDELITYDLDAEIGVAMSGISGWVHGIKRIITDEKGRVIIDHTEETLDLEEVKIQ